MMAEDEKEKGTGGKDEKDYELGWVDHAYSFVWYIHGWMGLEWSDLVFDSSG